MVHARYRKPQAAVKSHRGAIEHMLDMMGWGWSTSLSLLLDQAIVMEEGAC
jgi:hypothetical protein